MLKTMSAIAGLAMAPVAVSAEQVPLEAGNWDIRGDHRFETHEGKRSLFLESATAELKDFQFENGVIEYDVMFPRKRGFVGVYFRVQADGYNFEDFYIRPHQSGNPDANQYAPTFNGVSAWQIYYGLPYATPVQYKYDQWTHVKLVVKDDRADVYIDSDTPTLHIADLKHEQMSGGIGLWSNLTGAWFANLNVTQTDAVEIVGAPAADREVPAGLVTSWSVSEPIAPATLGSSLTLPDAARAGLKWTPLQPETNGIVNLSRAARISQEKNAVLARIDVRSDSAQVKRMRFGFSDIVKIYVNGALMFDGDDTYASRDYRHLGTVGFYDALYAPLKKGDNEIVFAVTESFGGWAVAGAFEDMSGISIR